MDDEALLVIQSAAIVVTLWLTGIGLGLMVRLSDILRAFTRVGLVARIVALDLILIPVAMWVAVTLLVDDEGYATGLLLVAFASAGPLGLKLAQVLKADTAYAIGIIVALELSNLLFIPLWAGMLGLTASADVVIEIVRTVGLLLILPLAIGMGIRAIRGDRAHGFAERALRLATVGLVVVVAIVVIRGRGEVIESFRNGAALASVLVISFALIAGWLLGWPSRSTRWTSSVVTACRANGAALAVATTAFAGTPEVTAGVVVAGLVSITLPTALAYVVARRDRMGRSVSAPVP